MVVRACVRGAGTAAIVAVLGAASPAQAPAAPAPVTSWGSEGSAPGQFGTGRPAIFPNQFDDPAGVAIDPQGNVVVADPSNHRIERFTPTGGFLGEFGAFGVAHGATDARGRVNVPAGVAVDRSGNTYVADRRNDRVVVFNASGGFRAGFGGFGAGAAQLVNPQGVALAGDGTLYVSDQGHDRIKEYRLRAGASAARRRRRSPRPHKQVVRPTGSFIGSFGRFGYGPGQLVGPGAIAVGPNGTVYVVDVIRRQVAMFDSFGRSLGTIGGPGTGAGQFSLPLGVAIDGAGNVLVSDNFNSHPPSSPGAAQGGRVERFTAAGAFIDSFGSGSLLSPTFLAVDRAGAIYVADYRRIVKFQ